MLLIVIKSFILEHKGEYSTFALSEFSLSLRRFINGLGVILFSFILLSLLFEGVLYMLSDLFCSGDVIDLDFYKFLSTN